MSAIVENKGNMPYKTEIVQENPFTCVNEVLLYWFKGLMIYDILIYKIINQYIKGLVFALIHFNNVFFSQYLQSITSMRAIIINVSLFL